MKKFILKPLAILLIKINYEHGEYCAPIRTLTYHFKSVEMIDNVKIVKVHINQEIKKQRKFEK